MISVLVFSFYPHFLSEKIPKTMIFSQIPSLTWSSEEVLHRELAEACSSLSIPFTTCERKKDYWWKFTVKKFLTFYLAKKEKKKKSNKAFKGIAMQNLGFSKAGKAV